VGRFGQTHHRFGAHGLLVTDAEPVVIGVRFAAVGEAGFALVTDVKQIAEHLHLVALLAFAEQRRDRYVEVLAEQVEQGGFESGHRMYGDTQVERLQATAAGITLGEGLAHLIEDFLIVADRVAEHQAASVLQRLADALATGHFTDAGVPGVVLENNDVAGKKRPVGATQVEQHAIVAGHWNHLHGGDDRRFGGVVCSHGFDPNQTEFRRASARLRPRQGQQPVSVWCGPRRR